MSQEFLSHLSSQIRTIYDQSLQKKEHPIQSAQGVEIVLDSGQELVNFCANNYLGLANDPRLIDAAKKGLDDFGFGCASVRFICGTQTIHKLLEKIISNFLDTEDTILYSSCFDANGGIFETLLTDEDAVISDELNHASIIDGIKLCKAQRYRYKNNDMDDLEKKLIEAQDSGVRFKMIVTDGVFSMDGIIANLRSMTDLAERYGAIIMVDDSHAVGFIGKKGRGSAEHCGVQNKIDIFSGTLGKALGGASGGYISGKKQVIDILRQHSRPYLFSNSLCPSIVAASLRVFEILDQDGCELRNRLQKNTQRFRGALTQAGFRLIPGEHPIIPIMLDDEKKANAMANMLLENGIYVVAFSYPVVPKGKARIRTQMSAAHTDEQIDYAISSFIKIGRSLSVIS
jgi:glycine C-acetyltransferase